MIKVKVDHEQAMMGGGQQGNGTGNANSGPVSWYQYWKPDAIFFRVTEIICSMLQGIRRVISFTPRGGAAEESDKTDEGLDKSSPLNVSHDKIENIENELRKWQIKQIQLEASLKKEKNINESKTMEIREMKSIQNMLIEKVNGHNNVISLWNECNKNITALMRKLNQCQRAVKRQQKRYGVFYGKINSMEKTVGKSSKKMEELTKTVEESRMATGELKKAKEDFDGAKQDVQERFEHAMNELKTDRETMRKAEMERKQKSEECQRQIDEKNIAALDLVTKSLTRKQNQFFASMKNNARNDRRKTKKRFEKLEINLRTEKKKGRKERLLLYECYWDSQKALWGEVNQVKKMVDNLQEIGKETLRQETAALNNSRREIYGKVNEMEQLQNAIQMDTDWMVTTMGLLQSDVDKCTVETKRGQKERDKRKSSAFSVILNAHGLLTKDPKKLSFVTDYFNCDLFDQTESVYQPTLTAIHEICFCMCARDSGRLEAYLVGDDGISVYMGRSIIEGVHVAKTMFLQLKAGAKYWLKVNQYSGNAQLHYCYIGGRLI